MIVFINPDPLILQNICKSYHDNNNDTQRQSIGCRGAIEVLLRNWDDGFND